jgi:hypothetical protein
MNFLSLRRSAPWICLLATAGCGASPPPDEDPSDAGSRAADVAAYDTSAVPLPDRAAPAPCAATGTGRLRVSLGLDPGLTVRAPDVWLMVRCAGGNGSERVLRWDRNATQVLDALAPGSYEVRGSSFVAPWSSSTRVMLDDGATVAVSLTLPPSPAPLAQLRSEAALVAEATVWRGSVPFATIGSTGSGASLEVESRPYVSDPPAATDAGFLSVTAVARNQCATGACTPYVLRALEIRTRTDGEPTGLAGFAFPEGERLDPGESKSVPQPLLVRGAMPDLTHRIELVLYGEVIRAQAPRY